MIHMIDTDVSYMYNKEKVGFYMYFRKTFALMLLFCKVWELFLQALLPEILILQFYNFVGKMSILYLF